MVSAQVRMKKFAGMKRKAFEFKEGDWICHKLQHHWQNSVNGRECEKLSKRFYGPYRITKKINTVAYKLALPTWSSIHPVFHISLLKAIVCVIRDVDRVELSELA